MFNTLRSLLLVTFLIALTACTKPEPLCDDPAGCHVFHHGETILFGVIAPLSGDQSCPEIRMTLENLQQSVTQKEIHGYPIDLSIWDTYSSDEALESSLVTSFSQPTLLATLVLTCNSTSPSETLRAWLEGNLLILTNPSQLTEGIVQLEKLAILSRDFLIIPRSVWMMSIIEGQSESVKDYDQR